MSVQVGFPVKLTKHKASVEEILIREARTRYAGLFFNQAYPSALTPILIMPNYNRQAAAVLKFKCRITGYGYGSNPIRMALTGITDGNDFFTDAGSAFRLMNGEAQEFDLSHGSAQEGVSAYLIGGDNATVISVNGGYSWLTLTNDLRFDADRCLGWVGDSISGPTTNGDLVQNNYHHFATRNWLMKYSPFKETFRLCNTSAGGRESTRYNRALQANGQGTHPVDMSIEFYQMGMNDHAQAIPIATYKSNIKKWIEDRQRNYPGIVLVLLGVTPAQGLARQNGLDAYRTAMAECVLEEQALWPAGDPMRDRIIGIDLGHCFDRTIPARFAISDGSTGDALHPGDVTANYQMFQKICEGVDFDTPTGQLGKNFVTVAAPNGMLPTGGLRQRGIFDLLKAA